MVETVVTVERTATTAGGAPAGNTGGVGGGGFWSAIRINLEYFQTVPGILKIVQFIFGILCMALASPAIFPATTFFLFVVVISFIATILWIAAYFLGIREALNMAVNWILTELINTAVITVLYFIAFIVQLSKWSDYSGYSVGRNIAAGVFGLFNFLAYTAGTYFLYLIHKSGALV